MSEWQPIETAPRDGSWFVTANAREKAGEYEVARFNPYMQDKYVQEADGRFRRERVSVMDFSSDNFHRATHWKPLTQPVDDGDARAAVERVVMRLRELSQAVAESRMGEFSMRVPAEPERDADLVLQSAAALLESANLRAECWKSEHLASNSAIEELQSVLRRLCDEVENTNLHGGGADDDACPLCNTLREARELLAHNSDCTDPRRLSSGKE